MTRPAIERLAIYKMAHDAIPRGGGIADGLKFLSSAEKIREGAASAIKWARESVAAVRAAGEPNPWRESSDDEIAAEILSRLEARK